MLVNHFNATLDQLVYVLELVDHRLVGDIVEGFNLLERRRQAYLEYDDDDIDQTLLGVGKFNELCQSLDPDYMTKLQMRINASHGALPAKWSDLNETAVWKKPAMDVAPYAYHSGLIISNEQLVEWEKRRRERDQKLSTSLLQQAAAFLRADEKANDVLPLKDVDDSKLMLQETHYPSELNLTVVGGKDVQQQSSLFSQKVNNLMTSLAIRGRLDTQVKLMQALVEESHKNRRLAARKQKIDLEHVNMIESLRPAKNGTEEEDDDEEVDLSALDNEIERLENELQSLRMDSAETSDPIQIKTKKVQPKEKISSGHKVSDVDPLVEVKKKIDKTKMKGDDLSLQKILGKEKKQSGGLPNINDLLKGVKSKPSNTSGHIWTPDVIQKLFADATNATSDAEIGNFAPVVPYLLVSLVLYAGRICFFTLADGSFRVLQVSYSQASSICDYDSSRRQNCFGPSIEECDGNA